MRKTETVKQFCQGKKAVYYTFTQTEDHSQLESFSRSVMLLFSFGGYLSRFADWGGAFLSARDFQRNENGKSILVIDEFPYAVMGNREIPSILQKQWDTVLKDENVMIILCGNAMSFIEKEILAEKNPLYGRAGGICRMDEMPYYDAVKSVKEYTPAEKATVYSICGGVPYYLEQFDTAFSLKENILRSVLTKGSILYSEPGFLLRQELREPSVYNCVISSIANRRTKLSEIQDDLMMEKNKLSVYLRNLIEPGLAEREPWSAAAVTEPVFGEACTG